MDELCKPYNNLKLLLFPFTCKDAEAERNNLLQVSQVESGRTMQVTFSHYPKQPSVGNRAKDYIFLVDLGGDPMKQERASVIAKYRADILGWLLLSCLGWGVTR